jgi:hypothetical protein
VTFPERWLKRTATYLLNGVFSLESPEDSRTRAIESHDFGKILVETDCVRDWR